MAGMTVGCFVTGYSSDKYAKHGYTIEWPMMLSIYCRLGRLKTARIFGTLLLFSEVVCAFMTHAWAFLFFRFMMGFGILTHSAVLGTYGELNKIRLLHTP